MPVFPVGHCLQRPGSHSPTPPPKTGISSWAPTAPAVERPEAAGWSVSGQRKPAGGGWPVPSPPFGAPGSAVDEPRSGQGSGLDRCIRCGCSDEGFLSSRLGRNRIDTPVARKPPPRRSPLPLVSFSGFYTERRSAATFRRSIALVSMAERQRVPGIVGDPRGSTMFHVKRRRPSPPPPGKRTGAAWDQAELLLRGRLHGGDELRQLLLQGGHVGDPPRVRVLALHVLVDDLRDR